MKLRWTVNQKYPQAVDGAGAVADTIFSGIIDNPKFEASLAHECILNMDEPQKRSLRNIMMANQGAELRCASACAGTGMYHGILATCVQQIGRWLSGSSGASATFAASAGASGPSGFGLKVKLDWMCENDGRKQEYLKNKYPEMKFLAPCLSLLGSGGPFVRNSIDGKVASLSASHWVDCGWPCQGVSSMNTDQALGINRRCIAKRETSSGRVFDFLVKHLSGPLAPMFFFGENVPYLARATGHTGQKGARDPGAQGAQGALGCTWVPKDPGNPRGPGRSGHPWLP